MGYTFSSVAYDSESSTGVFGTGLLPIDPEVRESMTLAFVSGGFSISDVLPGHGVSSDGLALALRVSKYVPYLNVIADSGSGEIGLSFMPGIGVSPYTLDIPINADGSGDFN